MDFVPFFLWSFLGFSTFGEGNSHRLESSFVGKKRKVAWLLGPLCLFWVIWKTRNSIAFEDGVLSIQKLKISFVYLLWSETKLWIKDGPSTLIDFIEWVCRH